MDIHQEITNKIIAAIEANPGAITLPWNRSGANGLPANALTKNFYQGVNVISLWISGMSFGTQIWGTYRQWSEMGCQVRKGSKGTPIIYYSTFDREDEYDIKRIPFIKQSSVFNADQVDGYEAPQRPKMPPLERLEAVDAFVTATGATIKEGGAVACYVPMGDYIRMPDGDRFIDTETSTRTEGYYSTLCHELCHWSGAEHRLARDMSGKFGKPSYAFEELIAELGAAFLCARLEITKEPRAEHAAYIQNWLKALKSDKKFIFSASTQAQHATDYLMGLSTTPAS